MEVRSTKSKNYSYSYLKPSTVKPVYNDHPWDREKVVVVQRWSLFRGGRYSGG